MKKATDGQLVHGFVFKVLVFLVILFSGLAVLATGLYPPFRGKRDIWSDVLGVTPGLVRLLAATTLMIFAFRWSLIWRTPPGYSHPDIQPSLFPVATSGVLLAGYISAFRLGLLDPLEPRLVSVSLVLWSLLFVAALNLANSLIPIREFPRYWTYAVLFGAAATWIPRLDSAISTVLAPMLIEPTLKLVAGWLMLVGHGNVAIRSPANSLISINVDGFVVSIAASCAGYQGAAIALMLVGGYVWLSRDRLIFPRVFIVFPLIAAGMFLLNSVRIFILILIGAHVSPAIAVEGFHVYAGWIYLVTSTLTACLWLETSSWLSRAPQLSFSWRQAFGANQSDEAVLIIPLIAFLMLSIILGAFSSKLNWLYPLAVVLTALIAWPYARPFLQSASGFEGQAIALGCAVAILWFLLVPENPVESRALESQLFLAPGWAIAIWIFFRMLGAVVVVPLVEELGFRGAIQGQLGEALKGSLEHQGAVVLSIVASAIMFGLLHSAVVAGTVAGLCYGWLRYHSGSLSAPILAHAVTNFIISMYVLMSGAWSFW